MMKTTERTKRVESCVKVGVIGWGSRHDFLFLGILDLFYFVIIASVGKIKEIITLLCWWYIMTQPELDTFGA